MRAGTLLVRLGVLGALAACADAGAGGGGRRDPVQRTLSGGTTIELRVTSPLTSRHNHRGDPVTAVSARDVLDDRNAVVIPAGTPFRGRVLAIAPAERPGLEGVLEVDISAVRVHGAWRPLPARIVSVGSQMQGRGVTGGDVVKVGAGTVAGGIAGRIIGGDRTGTLIGAAAGTAAGAVYANQTRDIDIVLPQGSTIRIALTRPLVLASPPDTAAR